MLFCFGSVPVFDSAAVHLEKVYLLFTSRLFTYILITYKQFVGPLHNRRVFTITREQGGREL